MTKQVNILFKKALTKAFHITAVIMIIKKFDELLRPIRDAVWVVTCVLIMGASVAH